MLNRSCAPPGARRKAGHHLIENQQRAVRLRDFAQKFQITRPRQINPGIARHRLDDDGGNLIFVRSERSFHRFGVVEWQNDCMFRKIGGHTGAVRMAKRQRAAAGFHEQ